MNKEDYKFELKLANGKSKKFSRGRDMYNWAENNGNKWEWYEEGKAYKPLYQWLLERQQKKN